MNKNIEKGNLVEKEEKKLMGGSFFSSILFHGIILLAIGGIVIVPAAVKKLMPVTSVAPAPVDVPEPPPVVEQTQPDQSSSDNSSAPSEPADVKAATQDNSAPPDNLVVQDSTSLGPQMSTGNGNDASGVSGDLFSHGTAGGTGNGGSGISASGPHKTTFFGTTGEDLKGLLVGQFYGILWDRSGKELPQYPVKINIFSDFVKRRGDVNVLSQYWKSKQLYHATHVIIPGLSLKGCDFDVFGEKAPPLTRTEEALYILHYRGKIAAPEDMTFRFAGSAYGELVILIDGQIVQCAQGPLTAENARLPHQPSLKVYKDLYGWESPDDVLSLEEHPEQIPDNPPGLKPFYVFGTWLTWKANEYHKIDILLGGLNTGILIQEKDKTYKKLPNNIPILPVFQVGKRENFSPEYIQHSPAYQALGAGDVHIFYQLNGIDPDCSKGPLFLTE